MPLVQAFAFEPAVLAAIRSYTPIIREVFAAELSYEVLDEAKPGFPRVELSASEDIVFIIVDCTGTGNHGAGNSALFDVQPDTKPERDENMLKDRGNNIVTSLNGLLGSTTVLVRITPTNAIWCE